MSHIFPSIMKAAYIEHGPSLFHHVVEPVDLFTYRCVTVNDDHTTTESVAKYIDYTIGLWTAYEIRLAERIQELGLKTLYVGAGSGRMLSVLQKRGVDIHGIDWQDDAVALMALAESDLLINAGTYEKMDGHALEFADNEFGLVVLPLDILEASQDLDTLLAEAKRVASSVIFVGSSTDITDAVDPVDGECTITWRELGPEVLPFTIYPRVWFTDKLAAMGATVTDYFEVARDDYDGVYWFAEAAV